MESAESRNELYLIKAEAEIFLTEPTPRASAIEEGTSSNTTPNCEIQHLHEQISHVQDENDYLKKNASYCQLI